MSLAIVLLCWIAASLLLSPLMGRFMSAQNESEGRAAPHQVPITAPVRLQLRGHANMRRNVAIQLSRRDARSPRLG